MTPPAIMYREHVRLCVIRMLPISEERERERRERERERKERENRKRGNSSRRTRRAASQRGRAIELLVRLYTVGNID